MPGTSSAISRSQRLPQCCLRLETSAAGHGAGPPHGIRGAIKEMGDSGGDELTIALRRRDRAFETAIDGIAAGPRLVLTIVASPVARVGRAGVAVVGTGHAVRQLGIGRARRARAGTRLCHVASAGLRPADGATVTG